MKTTLASVLVIALLSTQLSTTFAQGSLTPPGAPGPTMKSLDQIEARIPISSAPFSITNPGSYYLATNITIANGNCITIGTNGVTLDLNGFTISSGVSFNFGAAIILSSNLRDITIANGHIRGGTTNNGSGVYSGKGFANGIFYGLNAPANVLVSHVTISGCGNNGINLGTGDSTVVESCTVRTVGSEGIYASTIKESSASDCGGDAIYGDQVSNCRGQATGTGFGVNALSIAENCYGSSNGGDGVSALTAQNCYGSSNGGEGISAQAAHNCYGTNTYSGGLSASTAQNCYGSSSTGVGLTADIAQNCIGFSSSGTGLIAFIGSVSSGQTTTGTPMNLTHNINSF